MPIQFINYIPPFMHGSLITLNDCYLEINKKYDTKMMVKYYKQNSSEDTKQILYRNMIMRKYMIISKFINFDDNEYLDGITITVSWALKNIDNMHGDVLIVLESLDIYLLYLENKLEDLLMRLSNNFKHIYVLANPMNLNILKKYTFKNIYYVEYYIKLCKERLDSLSILNNIDDRTLIRHECLIPNYKRYFLYNNRQKFINTLGFKQHAFCRIGTNINGKQLYMENIGKLIFEYLYLNRSLDYYNYNRVDDDGIHYYMKLLDLDDNENHMNLLNYKDKVTDVLLYNSDDIIWKLIKSWNTYV